MRDEAGGSIRNELRSFPRREPGQATGLLLVSLLSLGLGVLLIDQPARCDESGTYLNFVRHGLARILTDYSSPNNHILHSLAAKVSTKLLGPELTHLRLPALLAGAFLGAASYLMVRLHFGRAVALLGAAWIATCPYLVDQSTNARGYTMIHLAFLLLLALAVPLLRTRERRPWFLFAAIGAAGVYAVPVMGFPLAIVCAWLVIGALGDLPRAEWTGFARRMLLGLGALGLLIALCYAPTYLGTEGTRPFESGGIYDLEEREAALSMARRFSQWLTVVWQYATFGLPPWLAFLTVGLAGVSVLAARRAGLRFFVANVLGVFGLLFVLGQRPPLWSLSFLVPVYWTAVAVGCATLLRLGLGERERLQERLLLGLAVAGCALNVSIVRSMDGAMWSVPWYFGYFDAEEASLYIDAELPPEDPIVGLGREMITVIYYQEMRGDKTPGNMRRTPIEEAETAYMIDAGFPRTELLREEMALAGFEEREVVQRFPHSTLTRFVRP